MELPLLVVAALVITLVVKALLAQAFSIPSASMEPQLRDGDRVLVSRTSYRLHEPRRGDIVVFPTPGEPPEDEGLVDGLIDDALTALALRDPDDRDLIKRVVGLPGETISARQGSVVIDGRWLEEPYLPAETATADFGPVEVPEGHVFVMGDNRSNSRDSRFREVGPVPVESIVGRAIARIWPPGRRALL